MGRASRVLNVFPILETYKIMNSKTFLWSLLTWNQWSSETGSLLSYPVWMRSPFTPPLSLVLDLFEKCSVMTPCRWLHKVPLYCLPSTGAVLAPMCHLVPVLCRTERNEQLRKIWLTPAVLSSCMSSYSFNLFSPVVSFIRSLRVFLLIWQDDYNESSLVLLHQGICPLALSLCCIACD